MLIDFGLCFFTVDAAPTAAPHASGQKIIRRHFDLAAGREDTRFLRDNSMACAFDLTRHSSQVRSSVGPKQPNVRPSQGLVVTKVAGAKKKAGPQYATEPQLLLHQRPRW
jgi:hypothetical protein